MKPIIFPYKMGSASAKKLANTLNTRRVFANRKYKPKRRHVIINWGTSAYPTWWPVKIQRNVEVLNKPEAVKKASNKLTTLQVLKAANIKVPKFTTLQRQAQDWLENDEGKVMCRTLLNSHSGNGIVVAREVDELVDAPLYTMYVKKSHEFRVHVFKGSVIDYVQKKKKSGFEDRNPYVRSTANGWVFCREGIEIRDDVKNASVAAVNALGLDFGAVDVVLGKDGLVYVLEVNTAIGMEGTTVEKYTEAFRGYING